MKFRLSIFNEDLNYSGAVKKVKQEVTLDTASDVEKIKYYLGFTVHSPYLYNSSGREVSNFIDADAIFLDFDDDFPLDVWKNSIFGKYNQIIYPSKSHRVLKNNKITDRFHVLLFVESGNKGEILNGMMLKLRNLIFGMGYNVDKCSDVGRLIFPSRADGSSILNENYDEDFYIIDNKQNITDSDIDNLFIELNLENKYIDDSKLQDIKLNADFSYKTDDINEDYNVRRAVDILMLHGEELPHEKRFTIACSLFNYYGENGKNLLLNIKNSKGTLDCWRSASHKNYSEITIGSLFAIAKEYGFTFVSNYEMILETVNKKYDAEFKVLEMQKKNRKEREIQELADEKIKLIEFKKNETRAILSEHNKKTSELYEMDITDDEREIQLESYENDKNIRLEKITSEVSRKLKENEKSMSKIDDDIERDFIKEEKELKKEKEKELKEKEKELKKKIERDKNEKKNKLLNDNISDLRRYVSDSDAETWERAIKLHPECKIFITSDGKLSRFMKFNDTGEIGQIAKLKTEWSGMVETSTSYTYKINAGLYNSTGSVIYSDNFDELNYNDTKVILNDPFNKFDSFYLKGELNIQLTPNLEVIYEDNENFEKMFNAIYGEYSEFLLKFLTMVAFEDRKDARPCVVINGKRGTGKSLYMALFKYLFKDSCEGYNDTQFNTYAINKIVTVDEKYSNRLLLWETIKAVTGNKVVDVYFKGKNAIHCDSISYFIVASNDRPIKLSDTPTSSEDNQVYAVKLLSVFSKNEKVNKIKKDNTKPLDLSPLDFLTNRLGHWLRTRGREIFFEILNQRKQKTLRYGIEVPITKTLIDWCSTGYPDGTYNDIFFSIADLISEDSSMLLRGLKEGYISKYFFRDIELSKNQVKIFFEFLQNRCLIDTEPIPKKLNNGEVITTFEIINKFQLLLWIKSFVDDNEQINKMLDNYLVKIDKVHYTIKEDGDLTPVPPTNNTKNTTQNVTEVIAQNVTEVIAQNVTEVITQNVTEVVTQNVTEVVTQNVTEVITQNVTEVIAQNVTEVVTQNVTEVVIPDKFKHLFELKDKYSIYNTSAFEENNETDITKIIKPKNQGSCYTEISTDEYNEMLKTSYLCNINNANKYNIDENFTINAKILSMINRGIKNKTMESIMTVFNYFNKFKGSKKWKLSLTDTELKEVDIKVTFYIKQALKDINENRHLFNDFLYTDDIYTFLQNIKKSNMFAILESIRLNCTHLALLLKEFNITIAYPKDMLFLLLYWLLAH